MGAVGKSVPRVDAIAKVSGKAMYPGDFHFSDQLVMKVLYAHHTHAKVLSIDTSQAEAMEGVVMVLTAKDVPVNEYGLGVKDQPVLCGPGSTIAGADIVRFDGDHVALVIAESEAIDVQARSAVCDGGAAAVCRGLRQSPRTEQGGGSRAGTRHHRRRGGRNQHGKRGS